jgi:hypothetical protein
MFNPATQEVIYEGENLTKDVWGELAAMWRGELDRAEDEQVKLMQAERRATNGERKNLSFGYVRMKVCNEVYSFWSNKLGSEIWQDESFKKWLEKRHDNLVKIKSVSDNIVV